MKGNIKTFKHFRLFFGFFFFWYLVDILIANNEDYSYRGNLKLFDFTHKKMSIQRE